MIFSMSSIKDMLYLTALLVLMHQLACLLIQTVDLIIQSCKITLQPLVLALQSLHRSQILAKFFIIESKIFLRDPVTCFIYVTMEHLYFMSLFESIGLLGSHCLEAVPPLVKILKLCLRSVIRY